MEGDLLKMTLLQEYLKAQGVKEGLINYLSFVILTAIIVILCILLNLIAKKIVIKILAKIIHKNKYKWDDSLLDRKVFHRLANLIPGIVLYLFAPAYGLAGGYLIRAASLYILFVLFFVFNSILDAANDIYSNFPISKIRPIKGLLQVVKIVIMTIIGIIMLGILMKQNPWYLLSGIGALAAVFSFVFKDTILGFMAGIQLTANDMLRIGDWIEMEKYGADGNVIDITLNTVKVQNFDKTIISIPAYAFVSDSFKNWRGMIESGGRRMKRYIYIDVNSITFCTPQMVDKFRRIAYLSDYISETEQKLSQYNITRSFDKELLINGRHMTNIGTFRAYIQNYLEQHSQLLKDMPLLVRQLPPTEFGLPLEIYAFTDEIEWTAYEIIQADIFDHIFSIAGEFGLRIFQNPSGYDVSKIVEKNI
jgi:miniconductance mechanosensitive channel